MNHLPLDYFARKYAESSDPWGFESRWYEARKYALTVAALPRPRYARGFEPGCSIGVLTRQLAARCDALIACELVPDVAARAATRLRDLPHVDVRVLAVPEQWPEGQLDLIVLSEIAYYLTAPGVTQLFARIDTMPRSRRPRDRRALDRRDRSPAHRRRAARAARSPPRLAIRRGLSRRRLRALGVREARPVIDAVAVVIPAHNEAAHFPRCLAAIDTAFARLLPAVRRHAVVVLDACSDDSAAIAARWRDPTRAVHAVAHRQVGAARAAGVQLALAAFMDLAPAQIWLATTDADSVVPADWLSEQLALASTGIEVVAGTIKVDDWHGYPPAFGAQFARWYAAHGTPDHHAHVHGANLGVRADAYLAAGGFAARETGEDHALWNALSTRHRIATRRIPVTTSARRRGRAPAGFSRFLADCLRAA